MPSIACQNCGAEIDPDRDTCPACGARRPRAGGPEPWKPPAARRTALLAGIVIALLILAALVWRIADSRRSMLESPGPILPVEGTPSK